MKDREELWKLYLAGRDDERSFWQLVATLVSIQGALLALIAVVVSRSGPIETALLLILPAGPLGVIAFWVVRGSVATIRNTEVRALEESLAHEGGKLESLTGEQGREHFDVEGLQLPSSVRLTQPLTSSFSGIFPFSWVFPVLILFFAVVPATAAFFVLAQITDPTWRCVGFAMYGAVGLLLIIGCIRMTWSPDLWKRSRQLFDDRGGW